MSAILESGLRAISSNRNIFPAYEIKFLFDVDTIKFPYLTVNFDYMF